MYKLYCRIFQTTMRLFSNVLPWKKQNLITGTNTSEESYKILKQEGIIKPLIITDKTIITLGLLDNITKNIKDYCIYDKTIANPTIENVEEALELYLKYSCDGLLAVGGGSVIDCAKAVMARVLRPNKTILQLKGILKVRKDLFLLAIPTTAGTGSETTIASVISDTITHEKYFIIDPFLEPKYAILDAGLTLSLPSKITAETGMDALTHAIEAFISQSSSGETDEFAKKAIIKIFKNLPLVYQNKNNIDARAKMLEASYEAGRAFTKAYVGYIHALSHAITAFYNTPHGLANAIILPYVLEYYGSSIEKKLSILYDLVEKTKINHNLKAKAFIEKIKVLNQELNIPCHLKELKIEDFDSIIKRALKEANPLYPVPCILFKEDLRKILYLIKGDHNE